MPGSSLKASSIGLRSAESWPLVGFHCRNKILGLLLCSSPVWVVRGGNLKARRIWWRAGVGLGQKVKLAGQWTAHSLKPSSRPEKGQERPQGGISVWAPRTRLANHDGAIRSAQLVPLSASTNWTLKKSGSETSAMLLGWPLLTE